jgi:hypothetical protein
MAKTILRASARNPVSPAPSKSPLRSELDAVHCELDNAVCVLHCVVQTLEHADDVTQSEGLARTLNVARQTCMAFDRITNRLDEFSQRLVHEGIRAQYPKASAKGERRHGR